MNKRQVVATVLTLAVLLICASSAPAMAEPSVTIELENPPPGGVLELAVDESYTFTVRITSDEPFILAAAMTDAYYPGRGMYWHGGDRVVHDTTAVLSLTMTGKKSTAGLAAVCDWPEPGVCWPEGVAPASIVAGVRYQGGYVVAQEFAFAVVVE